MHFIVQKLFLFGLLNNFTSCCITQEFMQAYIIESSGGEVFFSEGWEARATLGGCIVMKAIATE